MPTDQLNANSPWQLTPELQAALDVANARLAEQAQRRPPLADNAAAPKLARELVAWGKIKLKPTGAALLKEDLSTPAFFESLLEQGALADARRVLAHALPKRRALWWASLVVRHAHQHSMPESLASVLRVVTQYIVDPSEDHRRAAGEFMKRNAPNTIAGCLATAAFFSAGSVSPPGLPPVAPRPFVTGRLVGVCIYLASVKVDPACYKQYLREYLRWGRAIAAGEMLWETPVDTSRLGPHWSRLATGPTGRASNDVESLVPVVLP
jgi:hypothetical protein